MLWNTTIEFIEISFSKNEMGDNIENKTYREVYANKKDIRQSEFYQSRATGLKPKVMFEIKCSEYSGEKTIRYDKKQYSIIRTYSKNTEIMEIICEGGILDGSA